MKKFIIMNLQLFAGEVVNSTTSPGLAPEAKVYYEKNLIRMSKPKLVHHQFGQKRTIPKNGGKNIEFRRYAALPKALTPLTEGTPPPGQALNVITVEATARQYGDWVPLTDVVQLTSIDNNLVEATNACGTQAGMTLDTVVRDIMHTGTNVWYCPKINADGTTTEVKSRSALTKDCRLTTDVVDQVVAFLRSQNAPTDEEGYYIGIIHPFAAYDLSKCSDWRKPREYCNPEKIYKGEIGEYGGVRFVDTSEAKIYKDETCPDGLGVFGTLILAPEQAYGCIDIEGQEAGENVKVIVKPIGSGGVEDPLDQKGTCGWKAMDTAAILIENYIVRVESCSPVYSGTVIAN